MSSRSKKQAKPEPRRGNATKSATPAARRNRPARRATPLTARPTAAVSAEGVTVADTFESIASRSITKSVIVYGPQGCGKTKNAATLAAHFGLSHIVDDWTPGNPVPTTSTLILTAADLTDFVHSGEIRRAVPFAEAMRQLRVGDTPVRVEHPIAWSPTAPEILIAAADHIDSKVTARDKPSGERSMGRTVAAFAAFTGVHLTEAQGWLFMAAVKLARATAGSHVADDYTDLAAYAGLAGEAAARAATTPAG